MSPHVYATAIVDLMEGGMPAEKAMKHLDAALLRRGHTKLKKRILRAAERILARRSAFAAPVAYVANDAATKKEGHAIKEALSSLGLSGEHHTLVDETLIGGFRVIAEGREIDRSYKRQLLTLYRSIIGKSTSL
jgi:F0F1-type ATP synthase delta subunit